MKFAIANITEEFIQDVSFIIPSHLLQMRIVGRDPVGGTMLAFLESDTLLSASGFNGFVRIVVTKDDLDNYAVELSPVPATLDLYHHAMTQIFLKMKVDDVSR